LRYRPDHFGLSSLAFRDQQLCRGISYWPEVYLFARLQPDYSGVVGAAYMLRMLQRIIWRTDNPDSSHLVDLECAGTVTLTLLVVRDLIDLSPHHRCCTWRRSFFGAGRE
jgi:hypothetical protein